MYSFASTVRNPSTAVNCRHAILSGWLQFATFRTHCGFGVPVGPWLWCCSCSSLAWSCRGAVGSSSSCKCAYGVASVRELHLSPLLRVTRCLRVFLYGIVLTHVGGLSAHLLGPAVRSLTFLLADVHWLCLSVPHAEHLCAVPVFCSVHCSHAQSLPVCAANTSPSSLIRCLCSHQQSVSVVCTLPTQNTACNAVVGMCAHTHQRASNRKPALPATAGSLFLLAANARASLLSWPCATSAHVPTGTPVCVPKAGNSVSVGTFSTHRTLSSTGLGGAGGWTSLTGGRATSAHVRSIPKNCVVVVRSFAKPLLIYELFVLSSLALWGLRRRAARRGRCGFRRSVTVPLCTLDLNF